MSKANNKFWWVYLLQSERGRTYIGATTDIDRRLRQHNGEIRGGARATSKETGWALVNAVYGFKNRSVAYRWEALVKKRCRGIDNRREGLTGVAQGKCPAGRKNYIPPKGLTEIRFNIIIEKGIV